MRLSNFTKGISSLLLILFLVLGGQPFTPQSAKAANEHTVTIAADKTSVKPGDTFNINITVKNTGSNTISNLEIRVPFAKTLKDTNYQLETPSFNRVLDTNEYPAGFNSRSWLLNTLDEDETKTFTLKYAVVADPKTPGGIISSYNLPITWVDPAGAKSNTQMDVKTFRADVYIGKLYNKSYIANLPNLAVLDNPVSQVTLNAQYSFTGSKTTNLKTITTANIAAFPNFTLETQDVLLEWLTPINFSGATTAAQLAALDSSLNVSWGKVTFNPANLPFLANKSVRVTFKNASYIFAPDIKVDGEVKDIAGASGTFNQTGKSVVIAKDKLGSFSIVPVVKIEQAVIETDQEDVEIKGNVSDPTAVLSYKIDNGTEQGVFGIDLQTGAFTIPVSVDKESTQVEITTKYKNEETTTKIITVKSASDTTPTPTPSETPATIDLPFNYITIALLLAAIGILVIIGSVIYFLNKNRKKNQKKKFTDINLNPVVNKVSSIGTPENELPTNKDEKPSAPIDLNALKNKYIQRENPVNSTDTEIKPKTDSVEKKQD